MSEDNRKKTTGQSSGQRSGASSKSGSGGTRKSGGSNASKNGSGASKSGAAKSSSTGSSAKNQSARSAAQKSSQGNTSRSKSSQQKPSGTSNNRAGSPSSKSSGSKGSVSGQVRRAAGAASAAKKRTDDTPRNPRRDSQAERELHRSASARRIADERRRRKYNKNRRLYNFMFYAAIAVAVISVVIILSVTVLFNISTITVQRGNNITYTDEEILAVCGVEPGDNLFAIDTEQIEENITTALPYIETCNISRRLPSTLELDVHAAVVLGTVTTGDGAYIVLSASGRALEYADAYDGQPIARINGLDMSFDGIGSPVVISDADQLEVAAELVVGFSLYDLKLDSITFEQSGAVSAVYDGRINIRFGVPTNLSQKVQVSAGMITEGKIARNESGTLDLSIDERAVFTPDYLIAD